IAPALVEQGVAPCHLSKDGTVETTAELEERLLRETKLTDRLEATLFEAAPPRAEVLAEAYRAMARKKAVRVEYESAEGEPRQGDKETRRQGDKETRRQGDKETRRTQGAVPGTVYASSPCLLVSLSVYFAVSGLIRMLRNATRPWSPCSSSGPGSPTLLSSAAP